MTPASLATLRTGRAPQKKRRASTHTISEVAMIRASPWAWWMVRVVGVLQSTSAARFSLGIVRLVESAVKPSRRITKARGGALRALALPPGGQPRQQYLPVRIGVLRLSPERVGSQAIAQKHQGPPGRRALALLLRGDGNASAAVSEIQV